MTTTSSNLRRLKRVAMAALSVTIVVSIQANDAQAQANVGAQFTVGVPMGEFGDRLDGAIGFGLSAQGLYQIPRSPVSVGANLGFLIYGQETIRTPFGSGPLGRVDVDVVTTNNLAGFHGLVRLQQPSGTFRPYADGLIGLSYLFTESRIQDTSGQRPDIASTTNFDDVTFSFGAGAGFQATLLDQVSEEGRRTQLALDVSLRYLRGGEAEYLRRGSIREGQDGSLIYDIERSRTDLLLPQVGVVFRF